MNSKIDLYQKKDKFFKLFDSFIFTNKNIFI